MAVVSRRWVSASDRLQLLEPRQNPQPPPQCEAAKPVPPAEMPTIIAGLTGSASPCSFARCSPLPDGQPREPRALLNWLGLPNDSISALDKVVPIGLENIDQLVLGLKLKEGSLLKQIVLVVHTHEAFSMDALVEKLKAKDQPAGERTIYQATGTAKFPLDLYLCRTIAFRNRSEIRPRVVARRDWGLCRLSIPKSIDAHTHLGRPRFGCWELVGLFCRSVIERAGFEKLDISLSVLRTITIGVTSIPNWR
jgi:hypothetical protein